MEVGSKEYKQALERAQYVNRPEQAMDYADEIASALFAADKKLKEFEESRKEIGALYRIFEENLIRDGIHRQYDDSAGGAYANRRIMANNLCTALGITDDEVIAWLRRETSNDGKGDGGSAKWLLGRLYQWLVERSRGRFTQADMDELRADNKNLSKLLTTTREQADAVKYKLKEFVDKL